MPKQDDKSNTMKDTLEKIIAYKPDQPRAKYTKRKKPKENRGGKREGSGAPKKPITLKTKSIRMSDEQEEAFNKLGGAKWLREYLDQNK
jgi:hypothetical protein